MAMQNTHTGFARRFSSGGAIEALQTRQYLQPHEPLGPAVRSVASALGVSLQSAGEVMRSLRLNPQRSIGRLRGAEIEQLGRALHRLDRRLPLASSTA
jgi:hypothetical protein